MLLSANARGTDEPASSSPEVTDTPLETSTPDGVGIAEAATAPAAPTGGGSDPHGDVDAGSTTDQSAAHDAVDHRVASSNEPKAPQRPFVLGGRAIGWSVSGIFGLAVVAVVALLPVPGLYRQPGGTMEEGFMLYFPELVRQGWIPNVDFLHLYGPGSLHLLMGWYELFGYTLAASRTFGLLQNLGIIFAIYTLGRVWGRGVATAMGVVAAIIIMVPIGIQAMAWHGALALGLWTAVLMLRARHLSGRAATLTWLAGGLVAGIALSMRPDAILAVLAVVLVAGWRDRAAAWKWVLGGSLIGLLPMWVHIAMAGPRASIQGMVIDPIVNLRPGRDLPTPPSWGHPIDGFLLRVVEYFPPAWPLPAIDATKQLFLWFWAMVIAAVTIPAWAWWRRRRGDLSDANLTLLVAGLFGLGIVGQGVQRPDSTHLSWVTIVSFPLLVPLVATAATRIGTRLPGTVVDRLPWRRDRSPTALDDHGSRTAAAGPGRERERGGRSRLLGGPAATVGFLAVAVFMFVICPFYTYRFYAMYTRVTVGDLPPAWQVERNGREFYFGDIEAANALQALIGDLDRWSEPGERLIVGPTELSRTYYNETVVYWMFPELEPGTYFLEMDPGLADADDSGLADDVAEADWIMLSRYWRDWWEPNTSADHGSTLPDEILSERFCLVGKYPGAGDPALLTLYQRCDTDDALGISPAAVDETTPVVDVVGR